MLTPSDLRQSSQRLPRIYCLWLTPSVVNLVTLHSAVWLKPRRMGQNLSWGWDYCFPSGCCHSEGSGLSEQDGCCLMGDDSALGSWWLLSQLSPQSFYPQSLLRHLYPSLPPPLLEPWVSGYKWKFMCWPFKQLFASPGIYLWQIATLPLFASGCYLCTFWALVL